MSKFKTKVALDEVTEYIVDINDVNINSQEVKLLDAFVDNDGSTYTGKDYGNSKDHIVKIPLLTELTVLQQIETNLIQEDIDALYKEDQEANIDNVDTRIEGRAIVSGLLELIIDDEGNIIEEVFEEVEIIEYEDIKMYTVSPSINLDENQYEDDVDAFKQTMNNLSKSNSFLNFSLELWKLLVAIF